MNTRSILIALGPFLCGSCSSDPSKQNTPNGVVSQSGAGGLPDAAGAPAMAGAAGAPAMAGAAGAPAMAGAAGQAGIASGGASSPSTADATLQAIVPSVGALLIDFVPSRMSYTLRVPSGTTEVAFTATATSPGAKLLVNGVPAVSGQPSPPVPLAGADRDTEVSVVVTADNGVAMSTYAITVSIQALAAAPTIFSVGDSTMADYDPTANAIQRGWMQMLPQFLNGSLGVSNAGINGASSKSFYLSASWYSVKIKLKAGDYVFIQFGHNDEKDKGIEGASGVGTAASVGYRQYLTKYVNEARALGAIPVLFTPIVRLDWAGNKLTPLASHDLTGNGVAVGNSDYPAVMRDVATGLNCPLVDLTASSKTLVEQYGPTDAKALLYVSVDNTHLQAMGAVSFAQLAAQGLVGQGILGEHLHADLGLVPSSRTLTFGTRFTGTSIDQPFSIFGLSLTPSAGTVTLSAPPGFLLSSGQNAPSATLGLPYTRGALPTTLVSVRFAPTAAQPYSASLAIQPPTGAPASLALTASGTQLPAGGAEAEARYALDSTGAGPGCVASGALVCTEEALSGLYMKDYKTLTLLLPTPTVLPAQRLSIPAATPADTWPLEADIASARFAQFSVAPATGRSLRIDTVTLSAGASGASVGFRVYGSAQPDFGSPADLLDVPESVTNALITYVVSPLTNVPMGSKYELRVYPYSKAKVVASFSLRALAVHAATY